MEFEVLLTNLKYCQKCHLGPVPLTYDSVAGELKKGLGGYLYVLCQNTDCNYLNLVPYGKTYRKPEVNGKQKKGMPPFSVNTKLGTAMIDGLGGPVKVNNLLATLNLQPINSKSLKCMERRAGTAIEAVAKQSALNTAHETYRKEMLDFSHTESEVAEKSMDGLIDDLGVCPLPDASPGVRSRLKFERDSDSEWTDVNDSNQENSEQSITRKVKNQRVSKMQGSIPGPCCVVNQKCKTRLSPKYPCKSRTGMSCAVDTAWYKRVLTV